MSADARYKLSTLLDMLRKKFCLHPEFHVNAWHVPDPSSYWRLVACGQCAKEASDTNLKLDALENSLKRAGVKWAYDNNYATCNVKLPNNQHGLGYEPVQGHKTFHGFNVPEGVGFYQHERGGSITISEDDMRAMLTQARWEGMNARSVLGAFMGLYEIKPNTYSREVYTRDAGFTSPIKVKEIHGVRVPENVSLTIQQDGWLRVSIDGLRQLLLDATLRASPAKVD